MSRRWEGWACCFEWRRGSRSRARWMAPLEAGAEPIEGAGFTRGERRAKAGPRRWVGNRCRNIDSAAALEMVSPARCRRNLRPERSLRSEVRGKTSDGCGLGFRQPGKPRTTASSAASVERAAPESLIYDGGGSGRVKSRARVLREVEAEAGPRLWVDADAGVFRVRPGPMVGEIIACTKRRSRPSRGGFLSLGLRASA